MTKQHWTRGLAAAGFGLLTMVGGLRAQQPGAAPASGTQNVREAAASAAATHKPGDLPGPIDSLSDLEDTAKMLFMMADANNDGQISQQEATRVGNQVVGGFFFAADTNGDGKLSPEEVKAAREQILQQKPYLRVLMQRAKAAGDQAKDNAGTDPIQAIGGLLDSNSDKQLEASEVRQAVQTGVTALFASADTNRDGQLTPTELNAAAVGMARSAAQAAFRAADGDRNGQLSKDEFDKALIEPANRIFAMVDTNNDGQLSEQEAQAARQFLMNMVQSVRVPNAPNSPSNLIRSGLTPDQVAPVPNVPVPASRTAPAPR